jgi:replicative DNA helicase
MRRDFIALNKDQKFEILSFEFEMRMEDQMARDLSSVTGKSVKQLYSSESAVTDDEFKIIEEELYKMSDAPLFYVEKMISPTDVVETIRTFAAQRMIGEGKGLVVTIDHILLTKGRSSDLEKAKIDELCHLLVGLKKEFSYAGIPIMIILLSQLNREIQSQERVMNPKSHYPTQSDLFAASSVYQASDYVIVIHRPAIVSGMGMYYGPPIEGHPNGLPVMCPTIPSKTMVYLHLIKERFGQTRVIPCVENFQVGKITEYDL